MQTRSGLQFFRFGLGRSCRGQPHLDASSALRSIVSGNVAAMFFHDAVADAEPESSAFAHVLGGVERIEDALRIFNASAVVSELRANVSAHATDANLKLAGAPGFKNGVNRVVDDVQKDLLDLMRVGDNQGRFRRQRRARREYC